MTKFLLVLSLFSLTLSNLSHAETHGAQAEAEVSSDFQVAAVAGNPNAEREADIEKKIAEIIDYVDASRMQPEAVSYPLGEVETALRNLLSRLKQSDEENAVWFAGEKLNVTEKSILLDNAEVLAEYAQEIINLREADDMNTDAQIKATAAANVAKKWRILPKKKEKWGVTAEYAAKLAGVGKREGDRRLQLITKAEPAHFDAFATLLVTNLQVPVTAEKPTFDADEIIRRLRNDPKALVQEQLDKHMADLRRSNPARAKELEDLAEKYKTKSADLKEQIDKELKGKTANKVKEEVNREIRKQSDELRRIEADFREGLRDLEAIIDKDREKVGNNLANELEKIQNRLMPEIDKAAGDLKSEIDKQVDEKKRQLDAEIEKKKQQLRNLFKR